MLISLVNSFPLAEPSLRSLPCVAAMGVNLSRDVVFLIMKQAWLATTLTDEREALLEAVSVNATLKADLALVAAQNVVLRFSHMTNDIGIWEACVAQRAQMRAERGEVNASAVPTLQHARVDMSLWYREGDLRMQLFRGKNHATREFLRAWHGASRGTKCSSYTFTLTSQSDTGAKSDPVELSAFLRTIAPAPIFSLLTHLYLQSDLVHDFNVLSPPDLYNVRIPTLKFLRLKEYPQCHLCQSSSFAHIQHETHCTRNVLSHVFPHLRHLHLDQPVLLKLLQLPETLEALTLETIAMPRSLDTTSDSSGRSTTPWRSMQGYNVVSALRSGLMQGPNSGSGAKTIVVMGRREKTYGFEAAQAACVAHGIELRADFVE